MGKGEVKAQDLSVPRGSFKILNSFISVLLSRKGTLSFMTFGPKQYESRDITLELDRVLKRTKHQIR